MAKNFSNDIVLDGSVNNIWSDRKTADMFWLGLVKAKKIRRSDWPVKSLQGMKSSESNTVMGQKNI
jgi:hypothetical protein